MVHLSFDCLYGEPKLNNVAAIYNTYIYVEREIHKHMVQVILNKINTACLIKKIFSSLFLDLEMYCQHACALRKQKHTLKHLRHTQNKNDNNMY